MTTYFDADFEGAEYRIAVSPQARAAIEADAAARAPYGPRFLVACFRCSEACSNASLCRCCKDRTLAASYLERRTIAGEHRPAVPFNVFLAAGPRAPEAQRHIA